MWGGLILKRANSPPRITARRGGGVTKKMARSLLMDAAGVVFLVPSIGTPPRPREKRMLRNIFLIARPPLLAVMRGGEFAILKIVPSLDSSVLTGGGYASEASEGVVRTSSRIRGDQQAPQLDLANDPIPRQRRNFFHESQLLP